MIKNEAETNTEKNVKFSVVMPIHNEEKFLYYSLPSIYRLKPDEVILIFDRCTDNSLKVARKIARHFKYLEKTRFIELNEPSPEWRFRVAFLRRYGFKLAKNNIILNTDADTILDTKIREHIREISKGNVALISFGRKNYPITFQDFITRLASTINPKIGFTGIYAFSKKAWIETEDQEKVKKIIRAEDTHLKESISKKYKTLFIKTNSIHLRPRETKERRYIKGYLYWAVKRNPLWKVILHSLIYLRPEVLSGYIYAKRKIP
ncbi:MAG: glycosyltransferase family 2 protein [archaeon GB-1867-035]|nr:glycosyltransferase family 2 protein [Candidatus Culexmicrobium profundum]